MKPLNFMDALSDINDELVRGMLNDRAAKHEALADESKTATGAKAQSDGNPVRMEGVTVRSDGKKDDKTIFFTGKLRYLALVMSAAACIALVIGIVRLHPGDGEDSFAADSMFSEVLNQQTEPAVTAVTEAEELHGFVTTKAEAKQNKTTTAPADSQAEPAAAAEHTTLMTAESADEQTAESRSTSGSSQTTQTTKAAETVTTTTTTVPEPEAGNEKSRPGDWYDPYTQSYLLGDVDADGDITLIDYFLAAREYYTQVTMRASGFKSLDADAIDRANVDRVQGSEGFISYDDLDDIRNLAILRSWLGFTDMTVSEWIQIIYDADGNFEERRVGVGDCLNMVNQVFEYGYNGYNKTRLVSSEVPQPVCDFYNDAMTEVRISRNESLPGFALWSDTEFEQKMSELRALLAES